MYMPDKGGYGGTSEDWHGLSRRLPDKPRLTQVLQAEDDHDDVEYAPSCSWSCPEHLNRISASAIHGPFDYSPESVVPGKLGEV